MADHLELCTTQYKNDERKNIRKKNSETPLGIYPKGYETELSTFEVLSSILHYSIYLELAGHIHMYMFKSH